MNTKRQKAKAALLKWASETSPEQFVEEHKGIVFADPDHSPTIKIINLEKSSESSDDLIYPVVK